jgi:hypothetical protein
MGMLLLGVLMLALGVFVSLRPLWTHGAAVTGARWLDVTFALLFMLRGWMNVRTAVRRSSQASPPRSEGLMR